MSKTELPEWTHTLLGSEIALTMGQSPPSSTYNTERKGLPFFQGKADFGNKYPVATVWCDSPQKIAEKGSILFSVRAPVGEINLNLDRSCIGRGLASITANKMSDLYLFYLLDFKKRDFQRLAQGSTFEAINGSELKEVEVHLPPFKEQQKIAEILTSVDAVIENTQSQINKLEDLKKATMNELLTKGIGHTEFKDTEIGRVPSSWEVRLLSEVSTLSRGKFSHRPRNDPRLYGGTIPFIQTGDVPKESYWIETYSQTLNELGKQVSRVFTKDTLVITIAANIGELGILKFDSCFPDSLVGISVNSDVQKEFMLLVLKYRKPDLERLAPKNAQGNLNLERLNSFPIALPSHDEQTKISKIIFVQELRRRDLVRKRQTYEFLKQSLMQDLLTGKVRVTVN